MQEVTLQEQTLELDWRDQSHETNFPAAFLRQVAYNPSLSLGLDSHDR